MAAKNNVNDNTQPTSVNKVVYYLAFNIEICYLIVIGTVKSTITNCATTIVIDSSNINNNLKHKIMNVKRKCKVVMFPTDEATNALRGYRDKSLLFNYNKEYHLIEAEKEYVSYYNLYIISDDEIKEDDCYIDDTAIIRQSVTSDKEYWSVRRNYKKIIATTDISLPKGEILVKHIITEGRNAGLIAQYPQPSPQFIQKYIDEYNKGNKIEYVNVEYYVTHETGYDKLLCPKTDKDNCVTITKVKDSFTLEEMKLAYNKGLLSDDNSTKTFNEFIDTL